MVWTPTLRTKKGNVFFYFLSFNFCYLFFMRTCVDNAKCITSFNNFESEISMNPTKLFASPMIDWSLGL